MSFFSELKRRNVIRVSFAYLITAWLAAQIADLVLASNGDIDGASAVNEQWKKSNEAGIPWPPPTRIYYPA